MCSIFRFASESIRYTSETQFGHTGYLGDCKKYKRKFQTPIYNNILKYCNVLHKKQVLKIYEIIFAKIVFQPKIYRN